MPLRKIPDRRVDVRIYNEAMRIVLQPDDQGTEEGANAREFVIDETIAEFVRDTLDARGFSNTYLFRWTPERGTRRTPGNRPTLYAVFVASDPWERGDEIAIYATRLSLGRSCESVSDTWTTLHEIENWFYDSRVTNAIVKRWLQGETIELLQQSRLGARRAAGIHGGALARAARTRARTHVVSAPAWERDAAEQQIVDDTGIRPIFDPLVTVPSGGLRKVAWPGAPTDPEGVHRGGEMWMDEDGYLFTHQLIRSTGAPLPGDEDFGSGLSQIRWATTEEPVGELVMSDIPNTWRDERGIHFTRQALSDLGVPVGDFDPDEYDEAYRGAQQEMADERSAGFSFSREGPELGDWIAGRLLFEPGVSDIAERLTLGSIDASTASRRIVVAAINRLDDEQERRRAARNWVRALDVYERALADEVRSGSPIPPSGTRVAVTAGLALISRIRRDSGQGALAQEIARGDWTRDQVRELVLADDTLALSGELSGEVRMWLDNVMAYVDRMEEEAADEDAPSGSEGAKRAEARNVGDLIGTEVGKEELAGRIADGDLTRNQLRSAVERYIDMRALPDESAHNTRTHMARVLKLADEEINRREEEGLEAGQLQVRHIRQDIEAEERGRTFAQEEKIKRQLEEVEKESDPWLGRELELNPGDPRTKRLLLGQGPGGSITQAREHMARAIAQEYVSPAELEAALGEGARSESAQRQIMARARALGYREPMRMS